MTPKPKRPPLLLWIFWIAILAPLIYFRWTDAAGDRGINNVFTGFAMILIGGSAWLWAVLRWGPTARKRILLISLVALVAFFGSLRFKGFSGVMIPEFESRFRAVTPELPPEQAAERSTGEDSSEQGFLSQTTQQDFAGFQARWTSGDEPSPSSQGISLARDWQAAQPKQLWRQPIGLGWGGFSVVGDVAVTLEEREGKQVLIAYELTSGKILWNHRFGSAFSNALGGPGPRTTPAIANGLVVALGPRGNLICVNGADGELRWSHDLLAEYGVDEATEAANVGYGRSNSPLIVDDQVIVAVGGVAGGKQAGLAAFGLFDGELRWEGPPRQISHSSPIIGELAGKRQVLIVNEDTLSAHDPADGTLLWEHAWPGRTPNDANTSQPRFLGGDRVWISKGYGQGSSVLEVSLVGEHWKVEVVWHNRRLLRTKFTSAVIHEGHAYGLSDGILECGDLATGKRVWKGGRYGHGQLLLVDGMLLVLSEAGELVLVEATPEEEARELGRLQAIEGKTWNHIALSGNRILVRNADEAALYAWPTSQP